VQAPAGLTAAYELKDSKKNIIVIEKKISSWGDWQKLKYLANLDTILALTDFFTKNKEVFDLFLKILGDDAVEVTRKTRILFKNSYFDYPLTPLNALFGLGVMQSIATGFSYMFARIKNYTSLTKIRNFEDWVVDKFGRKLFNNFF